MVCGGREWWGEGGEKRDEAKGFQLVTINITPVDDFSLLVPKQQKLRADLEFDSEEPETVYERVCDLKSPGRRGSTTEFLIISYRERFRSTRQFSNGLST